MCKLQMYVPVQNEQAGCVDQLLRGWPWVRHETGRGNSFDGDLVGLMLYAHGA